MADIPSTNEAPKANPQVMNLVKAFYFSFEFSQGEPQLQYRLFSYIHALRPEWKIQPQEKVEVRKIVLGQIENRFFGDKKPLNTHEKIGWKDVLTNVNRDLEVMEETLNGSPLELKDAKNTLVAGITIGILNLDLGFLRKPEGRARKKEYGPDSKFDRWMSHLQYYALAQNKVQTEEYQTLFNDIRERLSNKLLKKEITIDYNFARANYPEKFGEARNVSILLSKLALKWEEKHPNKDFFEGLGLPEGIIKR